MEAANLCNRLINLSFVDNNGTKHKDLIVDDHVFKWNRLNKDMTCNYKCRVKDLNSKKECPASCTLDSSSCRS